MCLNCATLSIKKAKEFDYFFLNITYQNTLSFVAGNRIVCYIIVCCIGHNFLTLWAFPKRNFSRNLLHFGFIVFLGSREKWQEIMAGCKSGDNVANLNTNSTSYTAIEFGVSMLLCKQPDSQSSLKCKWKYTYIEYNISFLI